MAKVLAFVNQKGGVAKTTTSLTVAKEFGRRGYKTLLIDLDPQATLSSVLGVQRGVDNAVHNWLGGIDTVAEFEQVVERLGDVDIVPANILLSGYEQILPSLDNPANLLSRRLESVKKDYDYIVIDCPPSLGLLMKNCVLASDFLVVPVKPEVASVLGFDLLISTLLRMGDSYGKDFDIAGLLLTMCNVRTTAFQQMSKFLDEKAKALNTKVFKAKIRQSVECSNLIGGGENIIEKLSSSKVAQDYKDFVDELLLTIESEV